VDQEKSDTAGELSEVEHDENEKAGLNVKNVKLLVVDRERLDLYLRYLNNAFEPNEKVDDETKFYVKDNKYNIVEGVLHRTVKRKEVKQDVWVNLPVAIKKDIFEILYSCHSSCKEVTRELRKPCNY
jgi:hypothetical protein